MITAEEQHRGIVNNWEKYNLKKVPVPLGEDTDEKLANLVSKTAPAYGEVVHAIVKDNDQWYALLPLGLMSRLDNHTVYECSEAWTVAYLPSQ